MQGTNKQRPGGAPDSPCRAANTLAAGRLLLAAGRVARFLWATPTNNVGHLEEAPAAAAAAGHTQQKIIIIPSANGLFPNFGYLGTF